MAYHRQLLAQAKLLARLDLRKPQQGNLRRAVSAAYYAIFHFVIDQACRHLAGNGRAAASTRQLLARAFDHGEMTSAAKAFASGALPKALLPVTQGFTMPTELGDFARTFIQSQDLRHIADYDLGSSPFVRSEVLDLLARVEEVIKAWPGIAANPMTKAFMLSLLILRKVRDR